MKNWRTTILGGIGAIIVAVSPIIVSGEVDTKALIGAAVIALFGYLAKDAGVSGVKK